jgi:acyl carrier protein
MNRDQVRKDFLDLIKPYVRIESSAEISDTNSFIDDLKVNSTRFVDIILDTEDKFKIRVDWDTDIDRFGRVGDAVDFICEKAVAV